jgi:hypothetical protein
VPRLSGADSCWPADRNPLPALAGAKADKPYPERAEAAQRDPNWVRHHRLSLPGFARLTLYLSASASYAELSHLLASSPSLPYPAFDSSAPTPSITTSRASTANKSTRGGARGGSKSNMLSRAAGLCRFLDDGNLALEEECVRIERLLGGR